MERIIFRCTPEFKQALQDKAAEAGLNLTDYIKQAIENAINVNDIQPIKEQPIEPKAKRLTQAKTALKEAETGTQDKPATESNWAKVQAYKKRHGFE